MKCRDQSSSQYGANVVEHPDGETCRSGVSSLSQRPGCPSRAKTSGGTVPAKFTLSKEKSGKFTFALLTPNGQVIATSKEYSTKASALNGVASLRKNAPGATLDDQTVAAAKKAPAAKKTAVKRPAVKRTTAKRPTAKRPAAKAVVTKKAATKAPAKKAPAKKSVAAKTTVRATTRKAVARKATTRTPARRPAKKA
jgi:uncharacterized protein YegP (UPF0339 family)